jgi:hypothetical protein
MYLGFDPTVSSHFTVFLLSEFKRGMQDNEVAEEDEIDNWGEKSIQFSSSVFYNGALHVTTLDSSVNTVDTKGKVWRTIPTPYYPIFIGMSQGLLYAVHGPRYSSQLSIWVLKDYGGKEWFKADY